ncbi:MAG: hypothetical protein H0T70_07660 [Acidimicrobiia bacterium]|nr:hypothetical protein [Acidimicrobiia bacterium]
MLRTLTRIAISRGLFGGSRRWVGIGTVVVGLRALGRLANKEPKLVYSEDLAPGESLVITHLTSHV